VIDNHAWLALGVLLVAMQLVVWLGHRHGLQTRHAEAPPVPTEAVSALIALLGLLLAFTVSMAVSRFDARKQLVSDEANAIGTAALRARLLPEPYASESAGLFREYVARRVRWGDLARSSPLEAALLGDGERLQHELWKRAIAAADARRDPHSALYIAALNEVIDLQEARANVRTNRVPETVLLVLAGLSLLALAVASATYGSNGMRARRDLHVLAFAVWLVIWLIVDLDQPRRGFVKIGQDPMRRLLASLGGEPADAAAQAGADR
jgi:hypothetical protein